MNPAVVFDLDGTLLNTLEDLAAAGNHTLRVLGMPTHPVESYRHMVGNGAQMLVQRMLPTGQNGDATVQIALHMFKGYYARHATDQTAPYPDVVRLLQALREQGITLGVVSNKPDENVAQVTAQYFPGLLQGVAGLSERFAPKPDPASLLDMLERLDIDKARCVYVGDSNVDVETAHNAGLECIGVTWGFRGREELEAAGADVVVDNVRELYGAIQGYVSPQ